MWRSRWEPMLPNGCAFLICKNKEANKECRKTGRIRRHGGSCLPGFLIHTYRGSKRRGCSMFFALLILASLPAAEPQAPLALHPDNPHYFLFRGKPTALITSGEHYGAVLNLDFNYVKYLEELASKKLNGTRTFSGAYVEPQGAFNIAQNTLAPARVIC